MSRIYFHSPRRDAEVLGSERAHMGIVVNDVAFSLLAASFRARERYARLLRPRHHLHSFPGSDDAWLRAFITTLSVQVEELNLEGRTFTSFDLALNTIVDLGSTPLTLMARIHATCEIHGYVEGGHRAWLAHHMQMARARHLLRADRGWEDVISLLGERDDEPVVMSYSVTDRFPNPDVADFDHDEDDPDAWYELSAGERWERGMSGLRRQAEGGLELHPESFHTRGFGPDAMTMPELEALLDAYERATP